jgi:putative peptide zinc metalloprotease protein
MTGCRKYRLNPDAEILRLDTSLKVQMYQLKLGDFRYRINEATIGFLRQFETAKDEELLDSALQGHADLKHLFIEKRILIIEGEARPQEIARRKHPLALRVSLFSQRRLQPLTRPMAALFSPIIASFSVAFIVFTHALFFYRAHAVMHVVSKLGHQQWITALLACYFLILIHELGHSSACTHYGARHDDIGIGIYFIYPVFYANVTDCWRLPRYQRAVVDIAGLYFQLLASGFAVVFWIYTHQLVLFVVIYSSLATALVNLNPFLRFDGYWLLPDITALPSLQHSNQELWRYWWAKLLRKSQDVRTPEFFSAPAWIKAIFVIYSVCTLSFFAYFFGRLAVLFIPYLIHEYPKAITLVLHMIVSRQFNLALLAAGFRLVGLSATSFGIVMMLRGMVSRMFHLLRKAYGRSLPWAKAGATPSTPNRVAIPASRPE